MKKKIIFFLHDFYVGGAEKNIVNYANYLINQNIDVYIITLSNKGILKRYVNKKVKIINLKKKRVLGSISIIIKTINNIKPDFLFSSLLHITLLLCFLKKYKFVNSKIFIRPSNLVFNNIYSGKILKKFLINFFTKNYLNYGDLFFCISEEIFKDLKYLHIENKKIVKISNAIIDKDFYKKSIIPLKNKKLKNSDYILSIGRLTEQKNHNMLIEAFALIKKQYKKKIILVIIGEGLLRNKLLLKIKKKKLGNSIIILNNNSNVQNFINYSKLFVQTSLWEGQPNVLMEAIILNKRVIATRCPGQNNKYLSQFKNCYLLKKNSINNLADSILFFLKQKNDFKISSKKYDRFKVENSGKKILDAIKKN